MLVIARVRFGSTNDGGAANWVLFGSKCWVGSLMKILVELPGGAVFGHRGGILVPRAWRVRQYKGDPIVSRLRESRSGSRKFCSVDFCADGPDVPRPRFASSPTPPAA